MLEEILEIQKKLELARLSLEEFDEIISQLPIGDPEYETGMILLTESRYKLSAAYTSLSIKKAKAGIIGDSWYKQNAGD